MYCEAPTQVHRSITELRMYITRKLHKVMSFESIFSEREKTHTLCRLVVCMCVCVSVRVVSLWCVFFLCVCVCVSI